MNSKPKTILITGGAGFIGSSLADKLINDHKIVVIDNMNDYYSPEIKKQNISKIISHKNYRFYEGDILDKQLLQAIFTKNKIDMVIHLAARAGVRPSIQQPKLYEEVNVTGTQNILEVSKEYRIKKLIFASSSSVYGALPQGPFHEEMDTSNTISPYAKTKVKAEQLCRQYSEFMPIVCLRFFTVYGPRQRPDLAINKFISLIEEDKPIPVYGDGTTKRSYTYIDDIIDGIKLAMDFTPQNFDIFNLGGDKTIELNDLIKKIELALEKKAVINQLPDQQGDVPLTHADLTKARRILGYNPKTHIKTGLKKFIKWKKENEK